MLMIRLNVFNIIGALVRKNDIVKCSFISSLKCIFISVTILLKLNIEALIGFNIYRK